MKKKYFVIVLIALLFIPTYTSPIKTGRNESKITDTKVSSNDELQPIPFIYGAFREPSIIDPVDCWDYPVSVLIDHVAETLFTFNYSDPDLPFIPSLAETEGFWSMGDLEYIIPLKSGVYFHDGTEFNATVAQWNFDRMEYWWNFTGDLPYTERKGAAYELFYFEDGKSPVWNRTEIVSEYIIKIVLNKPFAGLPRLLTYSASAMLSAASTPFYDLLNRTTDKIVGTGPFVYDEYTFPYNITFHAYENYRDGKAHIEEMIFVYNSDQISLNNALLAGDVHFIDSIPLSMLDTLKAAGNLTVLDEGKINAEILFYLMFNNHLITKEMRQALSYAINYSYIIEELMQNTNARLKSPIPEGILYSDYSFDYPYFNITMARMIMQSMGFGVGLNATYPGTDDAAWQSVSFATYSFWVSAPSVFYNNLYDLCETTFDLIGVTLNAEVTDWSDFLNNFEIDPDWIDMWPWYFGHSNTDPSYFINSLFSNTSYYNWGQVNDPYLQSLIDQGTAETNPTLRETTYNGIQRYMIEDLMPSAWMMARKLYHAHSVDLTGFVQNNLNKIYFYDCKWDPYSYDINIISSGDTTFVKGSTGHNITWIITTDYVRDPSYNIYVNDILNTTGIWEHNESIIIDLDNLAVGTYQYRIEVNNSDNTAYDTIIVNINALTIDISHPTDISFRRGSTGNSISWYITTNLELNPTYTIYENDSQVDTNSWHSLEPVIYNLDHLSVGSYEYRIEALSGDESIEDILIVTVLKSKKKEEIPGFSPLIVIGITVLMIFYIYRRLRKKLH